MVYSFIIDSTTFDDYLSLKKRLHDGRVRKKIPDTWLFTSHNPGVFTLGRSFTPESMICSERQIRESGREIHQIERGGDVTYHGPSQVMVYPFIAVPGNDIEKLVRSLEKVILDFLISYSLQGEPKKGFPGIWCNGSKIASIGLAVRKWTTMHGLSFNHQPDDGGFGMIIPCGIRGITITSLEEQTGKTIDRKDVIFGLKASIELVFGDKLSEISHSDIMEILEK